MAAKKFSAFRFNEEEGPVEEESARAHFKFKTGRNNKSSIECSNSSPLTKYEFLRWFARGVEDKKNDVQIEPIDVDAFCDRMEENAVSVDSTSSCDSLSDKPLAHTQLDYLDPECSYLWPKFWAPLDLISRGSGIDKKCGKNILPTILDDKEPVSSGSGDSCKINLRSSSCASNFQDYEGIVEEGCLEGGTNLHVTEKVVVTPDYIICGDMFSTEPLLTFTSSYIKVEGFSYGARRPLQFGWAITDIINIECQWCECFETAVVKIHVRPKDTGINGYSDGESLNFAVCRHDWSEIEDNIISLDTRYIDIWNRVLSIDTMWNYDALKRQTSILSTRQYCPDPRQNFEDFIYPKGDPDAVSVTMRDIELLQPKTFVNDTIIDFYIKYLRNNIIPEEQQRFHFFNSFFFKKLTGLDKNHSRACEGRDAFQRICKWTRNVNLFEKDYIFIPINFSLHWSLIVICYPGEIAKCKDEEIETSSRVPCILHMDSIRGSHRGLNNLLQSYLLEEWKERNNELMKDVSAKFMNLQFVSLEPPQQENSFDCGLFLLHYVELFLEQAPAHINPLTVTEVINKDWFPPEKASLKRRDIRKLIYSIMKENARQDYPAAFNETHASSKGDEEDAVAHYLPELCDVKEVCSLSNSKSYASEIQLKTPEAKSTRHQQLFGGSIFSIGDFLEPGSTGKVSNIDRQKQQCREHNGLFNQFGSTMSPIEEEATNPYSGTSLLIDKVDEYQEDSNQTLKMQHKACTSTARKRECFSRIMIDPEDSEAVGPSRENSSGHSSAASSPIGNAEDDASSSLSDDDFAGLVVEDSEDDVGIASSIDDNCDYLA